MTTPTGFFRWAVMSEQPVVDASSEKPEGADKSHAPAAWPRRIGGDDDSRLVFGGLACKGAAPKPMKTVILSPLNVVFFTPLAKFYPEFVGFLVEL